MKLFDTIRRKSAAVKCALTDKPMPLALTKQDDYDRAFTFLRSVTREHTAEVGSTKKFTFKVEDLGISMLVTISQANLASKESACHFCFSVISDKRILREREAYFISNDLQRMLESGDPFANLTVPEALWSIDLLNNMGLTTYTPMKYMDKRIDAQTKGLQELVGLKAQLLESMGSTLEA